MRTDQDRRAEIARIDAMREGRIPTDIDPFSAEGKLYLAMMDRIRRDMEKAPKLSAAQKARIALLLKGGVNATAK